MSFPSAFSIAIISIHVLLCERDTFIVLRVICGDSGDSDTWCCVFCLCGGVFEASYNGGKRRGGARLNLLRRKDLD